MLHSIAQLCSKPSNDDSSNNYIFDYNIPAQKSFEHQLTEEEPVAPINNFSYNCNAHNLPYEMKAPDYQNAFNNGFLMHATQQLINTPVYDPPPAYHQEKRKKRKGNKRGPQLRLVHTTRTVQVIFVWEKNKFLFVQDSTKVSHKRLMLKRELATKPTRNEIQNDNAVCFYTHLPLIIPEGFPDINQTAGIDVTNEQAIFNALWKQPNRDNGVTVATDVQIGFKVNNHTTNFFTSHVQSGLGDNFVVCVTNIVHGVFGVQYKLCIIRVNFVKLSYTEKYDQTRKIQNRDRIEIKFVEGLVGGADSPPAVKEEEKTPRRFPPMIPPSPPVQVSPPPLPRGLLPYASSDSSSMDDEEGPAEIF
jgi:hypothetical protein